MVQPYHSVVACHVVGVAGFGRDEDPLLAREAEEGLNRFSRNLQKHMPRRGHIQLTLTTAGKEFAGPSRHHNPLQAINARPYKPHGVLGHISPVLLVLAAHFNGHGCGVLGFQVHAVHGLFGANEELKALTQAGYLKRKPRPRPLAARRPMAARTQGQGGAQGMPHFGRSGRRSSSHPSSWLLKAREWHSAAPRRCRPSRRPTTFYQRKNWELLWWHRSSLGQDLWSAGRFLSPQCMARTRFC